MSYESVTTPEPTMADPELPDAARWTFLTNHAHVLICLAGDPELSVRAMADRVGITERSVQRILGDLEEAGILHRERLGRRNRYRLALDAPLRHPIERHRHVKDLVALILAVDATG